MVETANRGHRAGPLLLCILDGWGHREPAADNAISRAHTPVLDRLAARWPGGLMNASEGFVGLPAGQFGNSEVGHMNLGAGRVVMQDLPRIDAAIASGALAGLPALQQFIAALQDSGGACHLLGLLSPGGVHSHQTHLAALAAILHGAGIPVHVHAFLDGRDTPPQSAGGYLTRFLADLGDAGRVATMCGRYYAMDRDRRWDRVEAAWRALMDGEGRCAGDPMAAIAEAAGRQETDEFVRPTAIAGYAGMRDGDGLLCANFRADRVRELLSALAMPDFDGFARRRCVRFAARLGMTSYSSALDRQFAALFAPVELTNTLGEVAAARGLRQLRIAETEKYAHVTFFFNGGREQVFPGEDRILVPSPKVATYDRKPEMAAHEVTDRLVAAIAGGQHELIIANYANPDMVGHTGDLAAAVTAAETVDRCIGRVEAALLQRGGTMLLTADHGNCEQMADPDTGGPHTAHTMNPVPTLLVNAPAGIRALATGKLADVAPTLLQLLGIPAPAEMTGRSLLLPDAPGRAVA